MMYKCYHMDVDRSSNIPFRNQAKMRGVVVNDIAIAVNGGEQPKTVGVMYGDQVALNRPSVAMEDLPTENHRADSTLQVVLDSMQGQLSAEQKDDQRESSVEPQERKEEDNDNNE